MKWIGGMEEVVGDVGYEFELVTQVVDSKWNSAPRDEPVAPESELETELVTVGSSYHFRKIVQEALLVEVTKTMELTSRSSTWTPDNLASDQGTWHQESGLVEIQN